VKIYCGPRALSKTLFQGNATTKLFELFVSAKGEIAVAPSLCRSPTTISWER
jgi:hypothetical protein